MTIITPWLRGIIEIVGEHDTGKTIAALQTVTNTRDIVFVDDDVKGEGTVRQMKDQGMEFDMYIDLSKERAKISKAPTADELLDGVVLPTVEKIVQKHHKVIIWDTWRIVYSSCRGHVERNQNRYSGVVHFRGSSPIIQGLISKVARMLEAKILNELKDSCDLLIITHHLKDWYRENVVVGLIPESSGTFSEVCNMRIWLRRNHQSKVPVMLFMKRPNRPIQAKGKIVFQNMVPLKITPTDKHESIWDAIAEYEAKPIQSRTPRQDETPTAEELAAISGVLSPDQQRYLSQMIEYQTKFADELAEARDTSGNAQERPGTISSTEATYPENPLQLLARAKSELSMNPLAVQAALSMTIAEMGKGFDGETLWKKLLKVLDTEVSNAISGTNQPPEKRGAKKK